MAYIEECPPEVVESIVSYLDLPDAGNLRLVNRCLRSKVTQRHIRSYFRSKRVHVTGPALRDLNVLTQRGWLGCEVRNLTLVGVVNNTMGLEAALKTNLIQQHPEKRSRVARDLDILKERQRDYQQLLDSGVIVHLLSRIFKSIAANGTLGKLQSLSLEVTVYRENANRELYPLTGGSWRLIWQAATEMFRVAFASLLESGLEIEHLDIFNKPRLQGCSLASNELTGFDYHHKGLSRTLGCLRSLSISVSDRIIDITRQDAQSSGDANDEINWSNDEDGRTMAEVTAEARDEQNFAGLANLIQACHQLKKLHIHQYLVNFRRISHIDYPNERLLQRISELSKLPELEECSLRGLYVRETDLLSFLKKVPLHKLSMEFVIMTSGTFRSIFDYCTGEGSTVTSVHFDELRVQRGLVHFTGVGEPRFQSWAGAHGSNTLTREGEDLKQAIRFHLPDGPPFPVSSHVSNQ
ncbi:hypothetical protein BDV12DRAFT_206355 [Aspergillus spectabilis]